MFTGYIRVAAALCIVTLITDIVATLLTGLGLRSKDQRTKYKFYRVAVYVMLLACKKNLLPHFMQNVDSRFINFF